MTFEPALDHLHPHLVSAKACGNRSSVDPLRFLNPDRHFDIKVRRIEPEVFLERQRTVEVYVGRQLPEPGSSIPQQGSSI